MDTTQHTPTHRPDGSVLPPSPQTRPSFLHRSSASTDSKPSSFHASPSIVHPLSPPLPPASFNPPPDIHPLLRAATQSDESHGKEDTGMPCVVSPFNEASPDGPPMIGLGPSIVPAPAQYFPLPPGPPNPSSPPGECHDQVDKLQRRLSEQRKRISRSASRGRERAGSAGRETQAELMGHGSGEGEREQGHREADGEAGLRGAREKLQAVLEEALRGMPSSCEGGVEGNSRVGDGNENPSVVKAFVTNTITNANAIAIASASASTSVSLPPSPVLFPAPTPSFPANTHSQAHAHTIPLSFEDLVRHKRRGSITAAHSPAQSLTGESGPTVPGIGAGGCTTHAHGGGARKGSRQTSTMNDSAEVVVKSGSSPPLSATERRTSVGELTKMRGTVSGEEERADKRRQSSSSPPPPPPTTTGANHAIGVVPSGTQGTAREIIVPASILQLGGAPADDATTATGQDAHETSSKPVEGRLGGLVVEPQGNDDSERVVSDAGLDATIVPAAEVAAMTTRTDPPVSSQPDATADSPHIADTHLWDSVWPSATSPTHAIEPRGVSYPKPMSDPRRSGSGALRPRLPMHSRTSSMSIHSFSESSVASSSSSSYTSPGLPMHSLSYARQVARPDDPPSPAPAAYPRTGIPLFFSEALTGSSSSSSSSCAPPAWAHHPSARRGSLASLGTWPLKRENSVGAGVGAAGDQKGSERRQSTRRENGAEGKRGGERVIKISEGSDDETG